MGAEQSPGRTVSMSRTILHRNVPIIEVADKALLDELLLDRSVAAMVLTRLSHRVALIDPGRFLELAARLRKLGHLPKVNTQHSHVE